MRQAKTIDGVNTIPADILEVLFDNITFLKFVYAEDDMDVDGQRIAEVQPPPSASWFPRRRNASSQRSDSYTMIRYVSDMSLCHSYDSEDRRDVCLTIAIDCNCMEYLGKYRPSGAGSQRSHSIPVALLLERNCRDGRQCADQQPIHKGTTNRCPWPSSKTSQPTAFQFRILFASIIGWYKV